MVDCRRRRPPCGGSGEPGLSTLDKLRDHYHVQAYLGNRGGAWLYRVASREDSARQFLLRIYLPALGSRAEREETARRQRMADEASRDQRKRKKQRNR